MSYYYWRSLLFPGFGRRRTMFEHFQWAGHVRKWGCSRWKFDDISFRSWVIYNYFRLLAVIFYYGSRPTSYNIGRCRQFHHRLRRCRNRGVSRWNSDMCVISCSDGHIGGHLEFWKCHVTHLKYAFHSKIYPAPNTFYCMSIALSVREHFECSEGGDLPPSPVAGTAVGKKRWRHKG